MEIRGAVVREKSGKFLIEDLQLEAPRSDELVVRVVGAGVCHTDLVCRDQYFPVPLPCVFGHECSGIVESVGASVTKVKPGDPVVLSYLSCGHCEPCLEGSPGYCLDLYGCNFTATRADASTTLRKAPARRTRSRCRTTFRSNCWGRSAAGSRPGRAPS